MDDSIVLAKGMVGMLLASKYKNNDIPTEKDVEECITDIQKMPLFSSLTEEDIKKLKKFVIAENLIKVDVGVFITDPEDEHRSWYPDRKADLSMEYWNRFRNYMLQDKRWSDRVFGNLDVVSDRIINLLGDPDSRGSWKRRGLLLGDVQSGKTINYTAICNKAADAGYRVIIILAGTLNTLRAQTQHRLDTDFIGVSSNEILGKKEGVKLRSVGVGNKGKAPSIMAFTSEIKDFDANFLKNIRLDLKTCNSPALFVVKKNVSILNNLKKWLRANNMLGDELIDLPMLLLDDEADYASINTKKEDEDPTRTNKSIREILGCFKKSSYVGVTATPFANIFINPETTDEMLKDDLFPKDFIYSLTAPSNYIGNQKIFGIDAVYSSCLEQIDDAGEVFLNKHKKDLVVNVLPDSLVKSVYYYLLINVIRDLKGEIHTHRSMLINISRFSNVQEQVKKLVNELVLKIQYDCRNYSKLSVKAATEASKYIDKLKTVWNEFKLTEKTGYTWNKIQSQLTKSIVPVIVKSINQLSQDSLDYEADVNGMRVIVVGGLSLSRGFTLEGLSVSYFYRNSQTYDTLMQMGRWFGYREGYDDIVKIWMSEEARDYYESITSAMEELKIEINRMNRLKLSPKDFGLKVREHPQTLLITAKNKMRSTERYYHEYSIYGQILETAQLDNDKSILANNEKFTVNLLNNINQTYSLEQGKGYSLFKNIDNKLVVDYLNQFKSHPMQMEFQCELVASFIESEFKNAKWDVVINSGSDVPYNNVELKDIIVNKSIRKIQIHDEQKSILINGTKKRVGTGGKFKIGLTESQKEYAEQEYRKLKVDGSIPDKAYLIEGRNPVLVIYFMTPKDNSMQFNSEDTIIGLSIGIPRTNGQEHTIRYSYIRNRVELVEDQWIGDESEDVEDDE